MSRLKSLGGPNQVLSPLDRPKPIAGRIGRPKGKLNKKTIEEIRKILRSGLSPLDFMIRTMRNSKLPLEVRLDAAKSAAPYVHRKLIALEVDNRSIDPAQQINPTMSAQEAADAYAMTIESTAIEVEDAEND